MHEDFEDTGTGKGSALWRNGLAVFAAGISVFVLSANYYGLLQPMWQTAMTMALILPFAFLHTSRRGRGVWLHPALNIVFAIAVSAAFLNVVFNYMAIQVRQVIPSIWDQIACVVAVLSVLEVTRRYFGWALPIIATVMIGYAFLGNMLPPAWRHAGWDMSFMTFSLYTQSAGLFGVAPKVAVTLIFVFVSLGAFLARMGTMDRVLDLSRAFTRGSYGGSAKVAVFSSAIMGTISGSSVANVVGTGRFTIPLMKAAGFRPYFAAAIEAVASTGGLLMPPVMGAGAFIMAELLQVPYGNIILAAIFPAILYFVVVFLSVHFESRKLDIRSDTEGEARSAALLRCGPYLIPVLLLLGLIAIDIPPVRAALYTVGFCVVLSWVLQPMGPRAIFAALVDSTEQATPILCACACAGIIIGGMDGTGLAIKFSQFLIEFAQESRVLALILGMIVVIILGMGLPATAAYILAAAVVAPTLIKLGYMPIAVHLFVFYYANLSHITPPVDLATYAASGIAQSNPIRTSMRAISLGAVAFILPMIFIHDPVLLLQSADPLRLVISVATAVAGTAVIAGGLTGWLFTHVTGLGRLILIASGGALLVPVWYISIFGVLIFGLFWIGTRTNFQPIVKLPQERT